MKSMFCRKTRQIFQNYLSLCILGKSNQKLSCFKHLMTSELKQRKLFLVYTVEGKFNIDIEYVSESGGGLASNFLEVASKQSKICREERFWRDEVADKVLYSSSLESLLPFTTRADRPHRTQIVASFKKQKSLTSFFK